MNIGNYIDGYLGEINQLFIQDLNDLWASQYCDQKTEKFEMENVLRCARIQPKDNYVNQWFENTFGIDYRKISSLYSL